MIDTIFVLIVKEELFLVYVFVLLCTIKISSFKISDKIIHESALKYIYA